MAHQLASGCAANGDAGKPQLPCRSGVGRTTVYRAQANSPFRPSSSSRSSNRPRQQGRAYAEGDRRARDDHLVQGEFGFRLGNEEVIAGAGSAVVAPRGMPHTFWNAGEAEVRYLLVMTPTIASSIAALHVPGADVPAVFAAHDSEILGWG